MPYPFSRGYTWNDFLQRLTDDFGVRQETITAYINDELHFIPYFVRQHGGKTISVVKPSHQQDSFVRKALLIPLCIKLQIDPAEFGFYLDP